MEKIAKSITRLHDWIQHLNLMLLERHNGSLLTVATAVVTFKAAFPSQYVSCQWSNEFPAYPKPTLNAQGPPRNLFPDIVCP